MTPETRAARDRITAYLDNLTHRHLEDVIDHCWVKSSTPGTALDRLDLTTADLRTVLAAIDDAHARLGRIAERHSNVLWPHDPNSASCRVCRLADPCLDRRDAQPQTSDL